MERLREMRATRPVQNLDPLEKAARGGENLIPRILEACENYATVGEISNRLRAVFGAYRES